MGVPSMRTVLPMMAGSPANLRIQPSCDSTMTPGEPGLACCSLKSRPASGGVPNISRKFPETFATVMRAGSPIPVIATLQPGAIAARSANIRPCSRMYARSAFD